MESIVTDIVKIIKSENNVIAREKALMCYFFNLIRELMKLALEEVDAGLVEETKKQGYQIEKRNKRSVGAGDIFVQAKRLNTRWMS